MKIIIGVIFLLVIHLFILFNLQFTAWPEMFSYPYLLNNSFKLYQDIALPYQPLLVLILSVVYKIFGFNLLTLQLFTWTTILISDFLIFFISRKIIGKKALSLVPLSLYIFVQPLTSGNMLWFDLATVPFILLGILSSLYRKTFWMGFFLSFAFFIKQQTGVAIILLIVYFLVYRQFRQLPKFFFGLVVPVILVLLFIISSGLMGDYLFWTTIVPLFWYPKFPGYSNWPSTKEFIEIFILFIPGLLACFNGLNQWNKRGEIFKIILLIFAGTFLVAFPRFDFFRFQPAVAVYIVLLSLILNKKNALIVSLPILLVSVVLVKSNLGNINLPARFYGPQEIALAKQIDELTLPSNRIYLLGVPSIEYVLSNRLPPKPWVDNYVWYMEIDGMQDKVLAGFEREKPKIIVWQIPQIGNWYSLGTYQPKRIVEYIRQHYEKTAQFEKGVQVWQRKD